MQLPETVEVKGMKVLTTRQIAEAYGVSKDKIIYNFNYNKDRYVLGKHYIEVFGEELRRLKRTCEIQSSFKYAKTLYLWTEKGALLHAKSLNTDKAWEVYDYLVDFYFRAKEEPKPVPKVKMPEPKPLMRTVVDVPDNPEILSAIQKLKDDITCMQVLLEGCKVYTSEESYKERRKSTAEVVQIIINDMTRWLNLKPGLIQKQY
ncbi:ORF6N domain-containing protein [Dorea formicigenerans]|uniref:ORF6N domain-containing protein n=1 Tax=Dorea formicigenerans TaxID=39486 RepID=A0A3E5GSS8_9FIRM|nr:ORF6N domain-containing protein [Dorea formicigenerans]RGO50798.1 ORF6N domain-containing protein [Dorea formicigenerans]